MARTVSDGERLKRDAHALLAAHRAVYIRRGQRALLMRLLDVPTATMDDVRRVVPLPATINPKLFGPVAGGLADAGLIRTVGSVPSRRPMAHARKIDVWAMVDRDAAAAWLSAHPDLPEQGPDTAGPTVTAPTNPNNGTGPAAAQPTLFLEI